MAFFKKNLENKFCPVCGAQVKMNDAFCIRCGYSFIKRKEKQRHGIKWSRLIFFLIIIAAIYLGIRYYNGQPIIPSSIADALNFTKVK